MTKKSVVTYQQLRDELNDILQELQREDIDVDIALAHYERGLALVSQLKTYLTEAKNRVHKLQIMSE